MSLLDEGVQGPALWALGTGYVPDPQHPSAQPSLSGVSFPFGVISSHALLSSPFTVWG